MARIEKKLLLERSDQNNIGLDSTAKILQGGQRGGRIFYRADKGSLKRMISRKNCGGSGNLNVALFDQSFENPGAVAQTSFDLR